MKANILVTTLLCCATIVAASHAEEVGSEGRNGVTH
jgi:hypothetical protein